MSFMKNIIPGVFNEGMVFVNEVIGEFRKANII